MKSRISMLLSCILWFATASLAHNGMEHLMGTVKAVSANSITVQTVGKESKEITIALLPSTKFTKDGADTPRTDLKVGDRVVVHAKPNGDKLEAVTVVFGKMSGHMEMHR